VIEPYSTLEANTHSTRPTPHFVERISGGAQRRPLHPLCTLPEASVPSCAEGRMPAGVP
jgi:hypothetical protein